MKCSLVIAACVVAATFTAMAGETKPEAPKAKEEAAVEAVVTEAAEVEETAAAEAVVTEAAEEAAVEAAVEVPEAKPE